jgi:aspartate racemase
MQVIGILGGMSDQATVQYYKAINAEVNRRLGGWEIAETLIAGVNFGNIESYIRNDQWREAGEYLAAKALALQNAGADFLICASNTMHRVADRFTRDLAIPFIHIGDPTGAAIAKTRIGRVGLLGTRPVMSAPYFRDYYNQHFALDVMVPEEPQQRQIDRIIFEELVRDTVNEASKAYYLGVCESLRSRGAEAVILGCTEIFMLIAQNDIPDLPFFDTTALHVAAAVDRAMSPAGALAAPGLRV